ncbi:hypothetical protein [Paenibacillus tuaregi]|uniref:hypothetical protein n=1 Tax=Paenibacillus tuaregi TaxID=1816681 RepID=UPI000AE67028|nr:hypothetical protein [Paenibacillus tuaregi]
MKISSRMIYWIGGSPCSGKSTIAELLTDKYDLIYYKCDEAYQKHIERCKADLHPIMTKIKGLSINGIFSRPLEQQVKETIMFYKEEFGMILGDIDRIVSSKPLLIEGAAILPDVVFPLLSNLNHGIWIIPTADFQIEQYSKREWIHSILEECQDPNQSFENWMNRDIQFAEYINKDAHSKGLKLIKVDGRASIEDNLAIVEEHFKLTKKRY